MFGTTADYHYILKLQINTYYFVISTKFILLHWRKASPQLGWSASKDAKVSSMAAPSEFYEPEDKRRCIEPEMERMSGNLMELNDKELNNINFGDEKDSDGATNDSDGNFIL